MVESTDLETKCVDWGLGVCLIMRCLDEGLKWSGQLIQFYGE